MTAEKIMVKYAKLLYGLLAVLGIIFLILATDAVSILAPSPSKLGFLLGGMIFTTVGIVGTGRQHFKNEEDRNIFTILAVVVLVPLFVFILILIMEYLTPVPVTF